MLVSCQYSIKWLANLADSYKEKLASSMVLTKLKKLVLNTVLWVVDGDSGLMIIVDILFVLVERQVWERMQGQLCFQQK